jgi:hypothetical protein
VDGLEFVVNSGLPSALSYSHSQKANAEKHEGSGFGHRDYRAAETEIIHAKETIVDVVRRNHDPVETARVSQAQEIRCKTVRI